MFCVVSNGLVMNVVCVVVEKLRRPRTEDGLCLKGDLCLRVVCV